MSTHDAQSFIDTDPNACRDDVDRLGLAEIRAALGELDGE